MKIVVVSGGFDPLHSGHIALLRNAAELGDILIAGLNSDDWLTRKKGKPFMPFTERKAVLGAIQWVDTVWAFDDSDNSACDLLKKVREYYLQDTNETYEFFCAKGGDSTEANNAEINVEGWNFVYGIGGFDKKNSSSSLLRAWNE